MKLIYLLIIGLISHSNIAQSTTEIAKVKKTCLNYIEGFYEGDTIKLKQSLKPTLYKFGYWKNKKTNKYESDGQMTYKQALDYAKKVYTSKKIAKEGAPKEIVVLDVSNQIAVAKIKAWWGIDYILLSKEEKNWIIEQVLWEGPLENKPL